MILKMNHITKSFHGVKALNNVDFELQKGEVHALVGENGAGKSTLMKILAGLYEPDEGDISINNQSVKITSPIISQGLGVSIIHQELNLIPHMSIAANIFLGRELRSRKVFTNYKQMITETEKLLSNFDLELDPNELIRNLSIGQQQIVEIVKALSTKAEILIMDEPTAVLEDRESEQLFKLIQTFKSQGVSIIYISHRLNELKKLCDRITVLRDGQTITILPLESLTEREIANLMVGRELTDLFPDKHEAVGEEVLRVENLSKGHYFKDVSFNVKKGEILGFAGLVGAGRTELMRTLFGDWKADSGKVHIKGKEVQFKNPNEAVRMGLGFATEDRKSSGLLLDMSVAHNITIAASQKVSRLNFIARSKESEIVKQKIQELNIKTSKFSLPVKNLSGGNQQKVVLAKWLIADTDIFILDEPTRGIDVGAKGEIYNLIADLVAHGKTVIVISSELPELLGICTRIIVMHQGSITGQLNHTEANEQKIMAFATGL
jgi:ABC-type sugar transport system ATPase subunit